MDNSLHFRLSAIIILWQYVLSVSQKTLTDIPANLKDHKTYANQAGWISAAQMPLIIALAGKNNLISCESLRYALYGQLI